MAALLIAVTAAAILAWREWTWRSAVVSLREERDRTRDELSGVSRLARDLRSPLQGVLGNTELMMAVGDSAAPAAEELRDIHDNAARAADIVRTIAAVADATSLSRRWHDLNDIVARALDSCRAEVPNAGVRVDFERSERLPLVYVDGRQLERALSALLQPPALSRRESGTATLRTRRGEGADDRLVVEFDDRSAPAQVDPLEDLAETRRILAAHGGRLAVDRPLRGGYRFVLELPVWTM